ncbi:Uncharacterised protein [uncultured Roseburia sp.]|uniref:DUF4190 domain-containing protein n=1 Tax=Brotonthovivens ammoniilytica TaxID=2981725 RepID=A0ABT2TGC6_9FIRM|nr:DUF3810 domain-containing protein [Brotonthovivens ammoniilytica]MCU6761239.1 DUF4190 domain-containing protein [Brotonthovivens ammoniilytica]SCI22919.1 Uncharacterised protein [uncultured Roseburia sp.]
MENKNTAAIIALVLGLVGIIAWLIPLFGYPVTIIAIVFGVKGRKIDFQKGMATAGLVLGIIFLVFSVLNSIAGIVLNSMIRSII